MMFIRVDLPEPDAPMIARNSPRSTLSETFRRACTSTSPMRYVFFSPSIWITADIGMLNARAAVQMMRPPSMSWNSYLLNATPRLRPSRSA
jgi:hypothetical protein